MNNTLIKDKVKYETVYHALLDSEMLRAFIDNFFDTSVLWVGNLIKGLDKFNDVLETEIETIKRRENK